MNELIAFDKETKILIDDLKSVCTNAGLSGDGNEYRVITQTFLYKFLNDKFLQEIRKIKNLDKNISVENYLSELNKKDYEFLLLQLNENIAKLYPEQLVKSIFERQNEKNFSNIFDDNFQKISSNNSEIFSIVTAGGQKVNIFENISKFVEDDKDNFCKAIINKLVNFSFERIFDQGFDFFAVIFEYLIKDYNSNSGSTYAEYFTPHAVSKIISSCLVTEKVANVKCYDPSAGSGTLLMNLAHSIGVNKCSIFSQDISQKSSHLLRLNLILNNLVHSIPNVIQGNTISEPYNRLKDNSLKKFDFIVSNPPFKMDFSDYRDDLDSKENHQRFFAGIPKIPNKKKKSMAIYLLFIQHIISSLSKNGKAAIVVPTGFLTASGIAFNIRKYLIDNKVLVGAISMPSNIFANTGTNVSIIFIDKLNKSNDIVMLDASNLGTIIREGKNQKTLLSSEDENKIIEVFNGKIKKENFFVIVDYDKVISKKLSLWAGHYFDLKIDHINISEENFINKVNEFENNMNQLFDENQKNHKKIIDQVKKFKINE